MNLKSRYLNRIKDSYIIGLFFMMPVSLCILLLNYLIIIKKTLAVPDNIIKSVFYIIALIFMVLWSLQWKKAWYAIILLAIIAGIDFLGVRLFHLDILSQIVFCSRYFLLLFVCVSGSLFLFSFKKDISNAYECKLSKFSTPLWLSFLLLFLLNLFLGYTIIRHNLYPSVWTIAILYSFFLTIYNFIPHYTPPKIMEDAALPGKKIKAKEILQRLKEDKTYRGQISSITIFSDGNVQIGEQIKTSLDSFKEFTHDFIAEILAIHKIDFLYTHQKYMVSSIIDDKNPDILVELPPGSGASFAVDLCAIYSALSPDKISNILYIVANPEQRKRQFENFIRDTSIESAIRHEILSQDLLREFDTVKPEILYCTPDNFHRLFLSYENSSNRLSWFIANLGMVIIENLDTYSTVKLTHLAYLVQHMRFIVRRKSQEKKLQFLITVRPGMNLISIAENFLMRDDQLGQHVEIRTDFSPSSQITYICWTPPLIYDEKSRTLLSSVKLQRKNSIREFYHLASNFSIFKDLRVLINFENELLMDGEINDIIQNIQKELRQNYVDEDIDLKLGNYKFKRTLSDMFNTNTINNPNLRAYDIIISLGIGRQPGLTLRMARKLLVEDGLFIHVAIPTPFDYLVMSDPQKYLQHGYIKSIYLLNRKDFFLKQHLLPIIHNAEVFEEPTNTELKEIFRIDDIENELLRDFIRDKLIIKEVIDNETTFYYYNTKYRQSMIPLQINDLERYPGHGIIEILEEGDQLLKTKPCDKFNNGFFENCKWNSGGQRFVVQNIYSADNEKKLIYLLRLEPSGDILQQRHYYVKSLPVYHIESLEISKSEVSKTVQKEGEFFKWIKGVGEFTINLAGIINVPASGIIKDCKRDTLNEEADNLSFRAHFMKIVPKHTEKGHSSASVSHVLLHILRLFFPKYIHNFNSLIEILLSDNGDIIFIEKLDSEGLIIDQLYDANVYEPIFEDGLNLLEECPCSKGCPNCLHIVECRENRWNAEFDKITAMTFLQHYLRGAERSIIVEARTSGLPPNKYGEEYIYQLKRKVLNVLEQKFELDIKKEAKLVFIQDDTLQKKGCLGCYVQDPINEVQITHGLSELQTISVMAHEYAHNWQYDPAGSVVPPWISSSKLKFSGKILIEGFAQWVSYRMMDFFSVDSAMESIDLKSDDEYGDGFDVMKYIEAKYGFLEVIRFIKGKFERFQDIDTLATEIRENTGFQILNENS
ncbi:hypothetical protein C6A36_00630 [Desulfobacteraceae bacterium SEEP-SAG10]|nr:hypothetical protein C6A36_00630 [Desulfobacteraceae bacterium SEEP-SAG10]